jgi:hypothetical protein
VCYNNYRKKEREVLTMRETIYIGGNAYTIRFYNGTHIVERNGEVVFEGWYEKCRAFVKECEVAYLEG